MNQRPKKPTMPSHLVALVSVTGVVKHVEAFPNYRFAETYLISNEAKNRVLLSYKQNCVPQANLPESLAKPERVFPKEGMCAILKPGTRFTVFHKDEQLAIQEGSRIAYKERTAVGLFEITRVLPKKLAKTEKRERRRVRA